MPAAGSEIRCTSPGTRRSADRRAAACDSRGRPITAPRSRPFASTIRTGRGARSGRSPSSGPAAAQATYRIAGVDRFNHGMSVDPVTGDVNVSFYDTRNDTTGARVVTDIYFTQSRTGGASWLSPNLRVTDESSNEHDCNGVF